MARSESPLIIKSTLLVRYARTVVYLLNERRLYRTASQLEGSSLSVRNNVSEANSSQSGRDFVHKLKLAHKELIETEGILTTLSEIDGLDASSKETLLLLCDEIGKMLSASIATATRKLRSSEAS